MQTEHHMARMSQPPAVIWDIDRIADAIARAEGAGPLDHMAETQASVYRAMARAGLGVAANILSERMASFPQGGRHTRAGWAVAMLRGWVETEVRR